MKIPTKTVEAHDWEALWTCLKDGAVVTADDMTSHSHAAFRMYLRTHKSVNLVAAADLRGGFQLKLGRPTGERTISPKDGNDWPALYADIAQGKVVHRDLTVSQQTAFRTFVKKRGHAVKLRLVDDKLNVSLGRKL